MAISWATIIGYPAMSWSNICNSFDDRADVNEINSLAPGRFG